MEAKINIAEILKDCSQGMELDCTMWDNVTFDHVDFTVTHPIYVRIQGDGCEQLTEFGQWNHSQNAKCVIFPKGKTTWEGFQRPFKDGDIITYKYEHGLVVMILSKFVNFVEVHHHCALYDALYDAKGFVTKNYIVGDLRYMRHATEEEKEKLFDAIKANGYKWNPETKTLEKLIEPTFKDGDVVATDNGAWIGITIGGKPCEFIPTYCIIRSNGKFEAYLNKKENWYFHRLATEEEKEKLFDAIKTNGYKWNEETKTLEKLNCFNAGDVLVSSSGNIVLLSHIDNTQTIYYHCALRPSEDFIIVENTDCGVGKVGNCTLASDSQKKILFDKLKSAGYKYNPQTNKLEKLVEPKFKVGDKVRHKANHHVAFTITDITKDSYIHENKKVIWIDRQDDWELVPDITTLKPFDKVLVRDTDEQKWVASLFSHYEKELDYPFFTVGSMFRQCIPYEGNEHLLGTTNDCDEFYKKLES